MELLLLLGPRVPELRGPVTGGLEEVAGGVGSTVGAVVVGGSGAVLPPVGAGSLIGDGSGSLLVGGSGSLVTPAAAAAGRVSAHKREPDQRPCNLQAGAVDSVQT